MPDRQRAVAPGPPAERLRVRRRRFVVAAAGGLLLAALLGGCAHKVVNPTLRALNEPENRELLERLLTEQYLQDSAELLARAVTRGALDEAGEHLEPADTRQLAEEFVAGFTDGLGAAVEGELGDAVHRRLVESVAAVTDLALEDPRRGELVRFASDLSAAVLSTLSEELCGGKPGCLEKKLGPAAERLLGGPIARGLARGMTEQLNPALADATRRISSAALQALAAEMRGGELLLVLEESSRRVTEGALRALAAELGEGGSLGQVWKGEKHQLRDLVLPAVLAFLVPALIGGVLVLYYLRRARKRDRALDLLTLAIAQAGQRADADRVLDSIRELGEGRPEGLADLREFLSHHPERQLGRRAKQAPAAE